MKKSTILMAGALACALSGPSAAQNKPVTLNFFHAYPSTAAVLKPIIQDFMQEHPEITINLQVPAKNYAEANETIVRDVMTNSLPDVYLPSYASLGPLVETLKDRNLAVDLTPMMAAEGETWAKNNYTEGLLRLGQAAGVQYAIPFNASTPILYVNEDLVAKAGGSMTSFPDTWEGVTDLAAKISMLGDGIGGLNFSVGGQTDDWYWQMMVLSVGGKMLNADGTGIGYNDDKGLKALELTQNLSVKTSMTVDTSAAPSLQQFFAGKLGMIVGSPSALAGHTAAIGGRFQLRTARFPMADKANGGLPTGGNALVVLAQDKDKQAAAWTFVKYLTAAKAQATIAQKMGYMPTNKNAAATLADFYAANPNFKTVFEQVNSAAPWFSYPNGTADDVWKGQSQIIDQLQRGKLTPKDALAQMAEHVATVMKQ